MFCAVGGVLNTIMMTANLLGFVVGTDGVKFLVSRLFATSGGVGFMVFDACLEFSSCSSIGTSFLHLTPIACQLIDWNIRKEELDGAFKDVKLYGVLLCITYQRIFAAFAENLGRTNFFFSHFRNCGCIGKCFHTPFNDQSKSILGVCNISLIFGFLNVFNRSFLCIGMIKRFLL